MLGMAVPMVHFGSWLAGLHGNLLAGWITPLSMAPAATLAGLTILLSPSDNWRGTALACLAGVMAAVQIVGGIIAAAFVMSHFYRSNPDELFYSGLPILIGIAVAMPVSFGSVYLFGRHAERTVGTYRDGQPEP